MFQLPNFHKCITSYRLEGSSFDTWPTPYRCQTLIITNTLLRKDLKGQIFTNALLRIGFSFQTFKNALVPLDLKIQVLTNALFVIAVKL